MRKINENSHSWSLDHLLCYEVEYLWPYVLRTPKFEAHIIAYSDEYGGETERISR